MWQLLDDLAPLLPATLFFYVMVIDGKRLEREEAEVMRHVEELLEIEPKHERMFAVYSRHYHITDQWVSLRGVYKSSLAARAKVYWLRARGHVAYVGEAWGEPPSRIAPLPVARVVN